MIITKEIEEIGFTRFHKLDDSIRQKIKKQKCCNCSKEFIKQNVIYATTSTNGIAWWCAKHPANFPHLFYV